MAADLDKNVLPFNSRSSQPATPELDGTGIKIALQEYLGDTAIVSDAKINPVIRRFHNPPRPQELVLQYTTIVDGAAQPAEFVVGDRLGTKLAEYLGPIAYANWENGIGVSSDATKPDFDPLRYTNGAPASPQVAVEAA